MKQWAARATA